MKSGTWVDKSAGMSIEETTRDKTKSGKRRTREGGMGGKGKEADGRRDGRWEVGENEGEDSHERGHDLTFERFNKRDEDDDDYEAEAEGRRSQRDKR